MTLAPPEKKRMELGILHVSVQKYLFFIELKLVRCVFKNTGLALSINLQVYRPSLRQKN